MKHLVVLIVLFALSAGQLLQVPSSFKDGVKWEFGTDVFHGDVSSRSNVNTNTFNQASVVPTVYKKELITPIVRKDPAVAVYNNPPDLYKKIVVPTVYRNEPLIQSVQQQQSVIPMIFKEHSIASNIYKSQPVVHNVGLLHKQQAAVPIVHKPYSATQTVSNVYQYKSQPIQPVVQYHEPSSLQDYVPKSIVPVNLKKKMTSHAWSYPHHALVGNVQVVPHY